jgi:predicted RecB family nuclease
MRSTDEGTLRLTPTDLTTFTACRHASRLEVDRAMGRPTPERGRDPDVDLLATLGRRHEDAYLAHLRGQGLRVERLEPLEHGAVERVHDLMREGVDAIAQAPLADGAWFGVADVLVKVPGSSALGAWHYEAHDTKLATTARSSAVLQLITYARMLERLQGRPGEFVRIVSPGRGGDAFEVTSLRFDDFDAVTAYATERFEAFIDDARDGDARTTPEPVEHCAVCPWWGHCRARWREADHLSLVANLGGVRRAELERHGVSTRTALAQRRAELGFTPGYGRRDAYLAAAHQADVQVRSERAGELVVDALEPRPGEGLARLPVRSHNDVYVDLEGTPFYPGGGIEYLWGWSIGDGGVTQVWADDLVGERRAFEAFVDAVTAHLAAHPEAHVVHFGPYEPNAFKRLMGRHGTREEALDALLRREAFVDLLPVARQGFRIGVEAYSLKDLERLHGYLRDEDLRTLGPRKREVEHATVLGVPHEASEAARAAVARYNADDVYSTVALHRWFEERRVEAGVAPRPPAGDDGEPSEALSEQRERVLALVEALSAGVPEDEDERSDEERARVLLAHLLDFERRESKVAFWTKFAHMAMSTEELEHSPKGITGLRVLEVIPPQGRARTVGVRYAFPPQDLDVRSNDQFHAMVGEDAVSFGVEVDLDTRTLLVKQGKGQGEARFTEGFFWGHVGAKDITEARLELADDVVRRGLGADGRYRAARDLLLGTVGRTQHGFDARRREPEAPLAAASRLALALDGGVLPVQGPPGAGKTYTAARAILALVAAGQRVAVTALSHKAIGNLLAEVVGAARAAGVDVGVGHRGSDVPDGVEAYASYDELEADLAAGRLHVIGGTAWAWTRPGFREAFDTVVIDEAGQFSLATALSVATAGRNLLLLGDPQQLTQPIQGTHPGGAEVSALEHLLAGHPTLPDDRGLFLAETWRMHPEVTRFVSRSFYEARLQSRPENATLRLEGTDGFDGAGIAFVAAEHEGRDGVAPEEVEVALEVLLRLTRPGARFVDKHGGARDLRHEDVLVIAPFNRHVDALASALPGGVRVGTVDRLQGQEAPVVLYALGVSSLDLAPRGVGFLFDLHRCNVAVSRAKARAIVIGSPRLFEEVPGDVDALRLVNAHVRLLRSDASG